MKKLLPVLLMALLLFVSCSLADRTEAGSSENPLEEILGLEQGVFRSAGSAAVEGEVQADVAECMAENGFEYEAWVSDADHLGQQDDRSLEWAQEWGFGVSTLFFPVEVVGPGAKGADRVSSTENPNQEIWEAMTPEQQQEYDEAFSGGAAGELSEAGGSDSAWGEGCMGQALANQPYFRLYTEFEFELAELEEQIRDEPRIAALTAQLGECVESKGFVFESEHKYREELFDRVSMLDPSIGDPVPSGDVDGEVRVDASMSESQLEELVALQQEEVKVAVAAFECGLHDGEFAKQVLDIENELIGVFVEEHREALEEMRNAAQ